MAAHILLVDDDGAWRMETKRVLEADGHRVTDLEDDVEIQTVMHREVVDLLILDIALPTKSGFEILSDIRNSNQVTPIILMSAVRIQDMDEATAITWGADDFLRKGCHPQVFIARIRSALRSRSHIFTSQSWEQVSELLELHRDLEQIRVKGQVLQVKLRHFRVMAYLIDHPNQICTYTALARHCWAEHEEHPSNNTINKIISRLRLTMVEAGGPEMTTVIETIHGDGYTFRSQAKKTPKTGD